MYSYVSLYINEYTLVVLYYSLYLLYKYHKVTMNKYLAYQASQVLHTVYLSSFLI